MKPRLAVCVLFLAVACSAPKDPVERGRARFNSLGCVTCHRVGGLGGGQAGPDLTTVGHRHSVEWMTVWMEDPSAWKPGTTMPRYKLTAEAQRDVVAYLASLKGAHYRASPPWNSAALKANPSRRGEMIYVRAGCVTCHGERGRGGFPNNNVVGNQVPGLTHARDGFSIEELKERIRLGRRPEPADAKALPPLLSMPAWKDVLTEDELDDLVVYLRGLAPAPAEDWTE